MLDFCQKRMERQTPATFQSEELRTQNSSTLFCSIAFYYVFRTFSWLKRKYFFECIRMGITLLYLKIFHFLSLNRNIEITVFSI
jgi:hypothetical protein